MSAGASRRLSADARTQGLERRPAALPGDRSTDTAGVPWDFTGRVVAEQSWREAAWPLFAIGAPSSLALAAWFASGSPSVMVWTGTGLGIVAVVADYRRDTRRRTRRAGAAATSAVVPSVVVTSAVVTALPVADRDGAARAGEAA